MDDALAQKLDIGGGQMTGPLSLGGDRLWDVANPTLNTNAATKKYVDDKDSALQTNINLKLSKSGDTMSGELKFE